MGVASFKYCVGGIKWHLNQIRFWVNIVNWLFNVDVWKKKYESVTVYIISYDHRRTFYFLDLLMCRFFLLWLTYNNQIWHWVPTILYFPQELGRLIFLPYLYTHLRIFVFKANQWTNSPKSQSDFITFSFSVFGLTLIGSKRLLCQPWELYLNSFWWWLYWNGRWIIVGCQIIPAVAT